MIDEGRRCALPGCDKVIRAAEGRPERRYCTAAHRAAARQARRAAMQPGRHGGSPSVTPAETLPWLRESTGAPAQEHAVAEPPVPTGPVLRPSSRGAAEAAEPGAVARAAARRSRDGGREIPRTRRRRTLAVIGVAGILAGGYAVTARPEAPAPTAPAQTVPEESADAWARHAAVALASMNRQLDTLAQTEDEWRQLPASRQGGVPAPVAALEERRSELQRRRATLQSQLDAYRSLRETQKDLAASEQHLRAVEKAIADAPQRRSGTGQEAALVALDEQRDLRLRQRDAQRAQLHTLEQGVSSAARTPLPDDGDATTKINRDVQDVVRNGGRAPERPDDPNPSRPDVVPGREQDDGKPRQETGTSGPPDPRGPRDESGERRAETGRRAATQDPTPDPQARVDAQSQRRPGGTEEEGHAASGPGGVGSAPADPRAVPTPGGPTASVTAPSGPTSARPTPPGPTPGPSTPRGAGGSTPGRHSGTSHGPAGNGLPGRHEEKRPRSGTTPGAGTTPETTSPGKSAPGSAAPERTAPERTAPERTAPATSTRERTTPPSRTVPGPPGTADRQADGSARATTPGNGGPSRASTRAPSERGSSERAPSERGSSERGPSERNTSHGPSTRDRSGTAARDGGVGERDRRSSDGGVTRIVVPVVPDAGTGAAQAHPTASGGRASTPPAEAGAGHRPDGNRPDTDRAGDRSASEQHRSRSGGARATPSAQHDDDGVEDRNATRGSTRRPDEHATTKGGAGQDRSSSGGRAGADPAGRKSSSDDGSDNPDKKRSRADPARSGSDPAEDSDKDADTGGSTRHDSRSGTDKDGDEARSRSGKDSPDPDEHRSDSGQHRSDSDEGESDADSGDGTSTSGSDEEGSGSDEEGSGSDEKRSGSDNTGSDARKGTSHEDDSEKSRGRSGDSGKDEDRSGSSED